MIKQKEAVFIAYQAGREQGLEHGSDAIFEHCASAVITGLANGEIVYDKDRTDEKEVKRYGRSLVSNWFKKDERIAGAKYVPGTKRGPQVKDDVLKKLNASLKSLKVHDAGNMALISQVQAKIEARKAELAQAKAGSKVATLEETMAALSELGIVQEQ